MRQERAPLCPTSVGTIGKLLGIMWEETQKLPRCKDWQAHMVARR